MKVFNRHPPLKKKILKARSEKQLRDDLILRKSIKKADQSLRASKKQKNYCGRL